MKDYSGEPARRMYMHGNFFHIISQLYRQLYRHELAIVSPLSRHHIATIPPLSRQYLAINKFSLH